jgi:hypothetical protein
MGGQEVFGMEGRGRGVKGTQQYMHVMMVSETRVILMSPFFWDVLLGDWFRDSYVVSASQAPITQ